MKRPSSTLAILPSLPHFNRVAMSISRSMQQMTRRLHTSLPSFFTLPIELHMSTTTSLITRFKTQNKLQDRFIRDNTTDLLLLLLRVLHHRSSEASEIGSNLLHLSRRSLMSLTTLFKAIPFLSTTLYNGGSKLSNSVNIQTLQRWL
jgi:hypothetical protein